MRKEIVSAARKLLDAKKRPKPSGARRTGRSGLTLRSVARAAKISVAAMTHHFKEGIPEIEEEALIDGWIDFVASVERAVAHSGTPTKRLHDACRAYVIWAVTHRGTYRLMWSHGHAPRDNPNIGKHTVRLFDLIRRPVAEIRRKRAGDAVGTTNAIAWMLHGLSMEAGDGWVEGYRSPGFMKRCLKSFL